MGRYFSFGSKDLKRIKPNLEGFRDYELNETLARIYSWIREGRVKIGGTNGRVLKGEFYLDFEGEPIVVRWGYALPREQRLGIEGFDINERVIHFRAENGHSERLGKLRNKLLDAIREMDFPVDMGSKWES